MRHLVVIFLIAAWSSHALCAQKVRGIAPERASLYDDTKGVFTCLDGSNKIPFNQVNDDYCDCRDGSDEPGTAACLNGQFACENLGYVVQYIPSSRVNDGICDCCDGSDEYDGKAKCENTCDVLAAKMKEEQERLKKLKDEGYIKRKELIQLGAELRKTLQDKLTELETKKAAAQEEKIKLEEIKNEREKAASDAKGVQDKIFEERANDLKKIEMERAARALFDLLDVNKDTFLSPNELIQHQELDILFDNDGKFTEEEALQLLDQNPHVDVHIFITNYYEKISPHLAKKEVEPPATTTEASHVHDEEQTDHTTDYDTTDHEHDSHEGHDHSHEDHHDESHADQHKEENKYDEETQRLIDEADEAKRQFEETEQNLRNLENDINDSRKKLDMDVGPNAEFASMIDKCFEYEDREYIYKLCAFEKTVQKSKSSHQETSIGYWKSWDEDESKKYLSMKFDNGLACWNGPQRSTKVNVVCGIENKLVAVSEPNRCEYEMRFETPAVCEQYVDKPNQVHAHEDL